MSPTRTPFLIAAVAAVAGCAGMSEQACLSSDWRSVGFEDGTLGRPVGTIGRYREACVEHGVSPDLARYRAGHAEGVEVYCRPGTGFEVGHSGARYHGVCPAHLEADFLDAYDSGRRLFELETALGSVESRIASNRRAQENVKTELTAIGATMVASDTTAEERVLLVADAAELGRRQGELAAELDALEEERVHHEIALREYRETLAFGF